MNSTLEKLCTLRWRL